MREIIQHLELLLIITQLYLERPYLVREIKDGGDTEKHQCDHYKTGRV